MLPRPTPDPTRPDQESVWAYPRPPALRRCHDRIQVRFGDQLICDTDESWQVLETSHPPTYFLPRTAFRAENLRAARGRSMCEWKGLAGYLDVVAGNQVAPGAAWFYANPSPRYEPIADHIALYAGRMDSCTVGGERVVPQPGQFYGGWITSSVAGPFKGEPGTDFW